MEHWQVSMVFVGEEIGMYGKLSKYHQNSCWHLRLLEGNWLKNDSFCSLWPTNRSSILYRFSPAPAGRWSAKAVQNHWACLAHPPNWGEANLLLITLCENHVLSTKPGKKHIEQSWMVEIFDVLILFDACQHKEVGDHNVMKCQRIFGVFLYLFGTLSGWCEPPPTLLQPFARHWVGKMVIRCSFAHH